MTFLATCPCKSVTCTAEPTKALWAFDPYSERETSHSHGEKYKSLFVSHLVIK